MGRFKTLGPRGRGRQLPARFAMVKPDHDLTRQQVAPWRAWYNTARWRRLRWSVLVRDNFQCRMCGRVPASTSDLIGDHITPHRGDAALFWDERNLQCLCSTCHSSLKQAEEARSGRLPG